MTVCALVNVDVYRKVGNLFDTSRGGAQCIVMEVCAVITQHLKPVYIRLPSAADCLEMSTQFEEKHGFPGICGCIDGTQITVKPPAWDRNGYINRKGLPSINVLAVCDNKMRFTFVYANCAGSVHDARVLRVSPLGDMLETYAWPPADYHILGDSAYPLLPNFLAPYRDNGYLTSVQKKFNAVHSSARSTVENAFARLKNKFRRLKGPIDATNMCNALLMIEASCTLHNFIMDHGGNGGFVDEIEEEEESEEPIPCTSSAHMGSAAMKTAAKIKRDRIASML